MRRKISLMIGTLTLSAMMGLLGCTAEKVAKDVKAQEVVATNAGQDQTFQENATDAITQVTDGVSTVDLEDPTTEASLTKPAPNEEKKPEETKEPDVILTPAVDPMPGLHIKESDGAYIWNKHTGYLGDRIDSSSVLMFLDDESLDKALKEFGLDQTEEEELIDLAKEFQHIRTEYPIEDYFYVFSYVPVSSSGYQMHADRVVLVNLDSGESYCLIGLDEYQEPAPDEMSLTVMDGFVHLAAVPRSFLTK